MNLARPFSVASEAAPFVRAMLVGPEAFRAALDNHIGALRHDATMASVVQAAEVFHAGTGTERLAGSMIDLLTIPISTEASASSFATAIAALPSGYYALGRGALQSALAEKQGVLTLDASLPRRRKPAAVVGQTNDEHWQRCVGGSEYQMATFWRLQDLPTFSDATVTGKLLETFGTYATAPVETKRTRLEAVWNADKTSMADRALAMALWYDDVQNAPITEDVIPPAERGIAMALALLSVPNSITHNAKAAMASSPDIERVAGQMLDVAVNSPEATIRSRSRSVLGGLLQVSGNEWAPDYLHYVRDALGQAGLPEDRQWTLLQLYSGILAAHGPSLITSETDRDTIIAGALGCLDMACDARLAEQTRTDALSLAIYAVGKFVPAGAQILYDWVRWQIETAQNPHMAYGYANNYLSIFTAIGSCHEGIVPINGQQREVALCALRRTDLSTKDRNELWDRMNTNQGSWTLVRNGLARWRGPAADPKPAQLARAA